MTLWLGIADNELIVADAEDDLALFTEVAETNTVAKPLSVKLNNKTLQLYHT